MGWRGALRSLESAARRAEREYQRKQKSIDKKRELEDAAFEVEEYEENVNSLISLHNTCLTKCDWEKIRLEKPPSKAEKLQKNETKAKAKLNNFEPNFFHKLFNLTESKLEKLRKNVLEAQKKDEDQYRTSMESYKNNYSSWENDQKISEGVLRGNLDSYIEAFKIISPLDELEDFILNSDFRALNSSLAEIVLTTKGEQIIPNEIKSLLRSGRLSTKKMPKGQFYETYQDHICSCALRIILFQTLSDLNENFFVTIFN